MKDKYDKGYRKKEFEELKATQFLYVAKFIASWKSLRFDKSLTLCRFLNVPAFKSYILRCKIGEK